MQSNGVVNLNLLIYVYLLLLRLASKYLNDTRGRRKLEKQNTKIVKHKINTVNISLKTTLGLSGKTDF